MGRKIPGIGRLAAALAVTAGVWACEGDLRLARECYRIGDLQRSQRFFESEIDHNPLSFEARYGYAIVLQEICLGKKALGQDRAEDWMVVAKAYGICAKLGEVRSFSENYAMALFHLANKLYAEEKYLPALDYLSEARKLEPKNKYVLNLAGIVEYSLGRYNRAQETLEYLLAVDPSFISAYLNLGNVLWEAGQEDAALVTWKQALSLSPGNQAIINRIESALKKIAGP